MYINDSTFVKYAHDARVSHLAEEYAQAQSDSRFVAAKYTQAVNWVRDQVRDLTSGINQGNSGTLQPSA